MEHHARIWSQHGLSLARLKLTLQKKAEIFSNTGIFSYQVSYSKILKTSLQPCLVQKALQTSHMFYSQQINSHSPSRLSTLHTITLRFSHFFTLFALKSWQFFSLGVSCCKMEGFLLLGLYASEGLCKQINLMQDTVNLQPGSDFPKTQHFTSKKIHK